MMLKEFKAARKNYLFCLIVSNILYTIVYSYISFAFIKAVKVDSMHDFLYQPRNVHLKVECIGITPLAYTCTCISRPEAYARKLLV